jgi:hypothetical protein
MKYYISIAILALSLFCVSPVSAAYKFKTKQAQTLISSEGSSAMGNLSVVSGAKMTSTSVMPRGRGTGKAAVQSLLFGWLSIFPILGLAFAAIAYYKGYGNTARIRKGHGYAIAGITLATIGVIFSVLILALG